MKPFLIGVDIGGTKIATGLVDRSGKMLERVVEPTEAVQGPDAVIRRMVGAIRTALARRNLTPADLAGIGVCAPGPIDPDAGMVVTAPNLGWDHVALAPRLSSEFGVPTYLGNDANAAALGESRFGAGRGVRNMVYITVSTGVGGGIVSEGKIINGTHFSAGEIGHIIVVPHDGPRCGCGQEGCLEAMSSGTAIARRAVAALDAGRPSLIRDLVGNDLSKVTPAEVGQAAKQGDALAQEVLTEAWHYLGIGIINLINLFDPEMIVIGGGVAQLGDQLFDPVRRFVRERALGDLGSKVKILPAELGGDVGILGAATLVLQGEEGDQALRYSAGA